MDANTLKPLMEVFLGTLPIPPELVYSLLATIVGGIPIAFLGHRLSLYRQRRLEYNAVTETIRPILYAEYRSLPFATDGLNVAQLAKLESVQIGWLRRIRCRRAAQDYKAKKGFYKHGSPYQDGYEVQEAINRLYDLALRCK